MSKISTKQFLEELKNVRRLPLETKPKEWMTIREIAEGANMSERKSREALRLISRTGKLETRKFVIETGVTRIRKPIVHFRIKGRNDMLDIVKGIKITWL
jgi:hypothetical protein